MTLAEKIAALRGEQKLSQGDLAEKLGVSRQSVSKWETGQAVPELDKIVRLADVFGVSMDVLVRDGEALKSEAPKAEAAPAAEPEPKIVYVEPRRLRPMQIVGVVLLVLGLLSVIFGVAMSGTYLAMIGAAMVVLGLPLLLARKHPFLITGWVVLAVSCLVLNPYTSVSPWGLRGGMLWLYLYLTRPELHYATNLFAAVVGIVRGLLALTLIIYTALLCLRRWRKKNV